MSRERDIKQPIMATAGNEDIAGLLSSISSFIAPLLPAEWTFTLYLHCPVDDPSEVDTYWIGNMAEADFYKSVGTHFSKWLHTNLDSELGAARVGELLNKLDTHNSRGDRI